MPPLRPENATMSRIEPSVAPAVNSAAPRPAWGVVLAASAFFLVLFWPILRVRFHFYLDDTEAGARYSHCVLLPLVSALWIYDRWGTLSRVPRSVSARGVVCVAVAALLYVYGRAIRMNLIQHVAMLATLGGLVWALAGPALLRALTFPISYLALMIPLHTPIDDGITVPLQGIATRMAQAFFEALGWIVVREGNVLQLPRVKLLVEEGCSGIRSLYALIALAVAWVFFVERPTWLRITLVAAALPVAVVANAVRVAVTGVLAYKVDPKYAQGLSHETAGLVVFAIGVAMLLALDWCLRPDAPAKSANDAM
jgi:exosortase